MRYNIINTLMITTLIISTCLIFTTTTTTATWEPNLPVLDTTGKPVRRGEKYFIKSIIHGGHPMATIINRTTSSSAAALHVGIEEDVSSSYASGLPVTLSPFKSGDKVVKEGKSFKVAFSNSAAVVTWKVGVKESRTERRFVVTGDNVGYSNYFYVKKWKNHDNYGNNERYVYELGWCPKEISGSYCKLSCGDVGFFVESGKRLLTLDAGTPLPITFVKA